MMTDNLPSTTKRTVLKGLAAAGLLSTGVGEVAAKRGSVQGGKNSQVPKNGHDTTTPIEHLVVIFQENVSFDHYFGTYPHAKNPSGVPQFNAKPDTPEVNGLANALLNNNPNKYNPNRLSRNHAVTADMNHDYEAEQKAFDHGLMDKFVQYTEGGTWNSDQYDPQGIVMDYYDGNTVTAMWNYAQHFAMNDNSHGTVTGPSTPGALNLVSGQTHGGYFVDKNGNKIPNPPSKLTNHLLADVNNNGVGTVIGDHDPGLDQWGNDPGLVMEGKNIGDLLNKKGVSWGWFQGGFNNKSASHKDVAGDSYPDYSSHHASFQYYKSTANPSHQPPASLNEVGHNGQANHQYGLSYFFKALNNRQLPAVNFLKAAMYQDGHAGYSDPLDEQHFLVNTINAIQKSPYWDKTAVVIMYDDSDGWYDHQMPPMVNPSKSKYDVLTGKNQSGTGTPLGGYQGRYGYGPRLPFMVVSPYSKVNEVDSTLTDQSSVIRFIEDNWNTGRIGDGSFDQLAGTIENMFDFNKKPANRLFLDPKTGKQIHGNTRGPSNMTGHKSVPNQ